MLATAIDIVASDTKCIRSEGERVCTVDFDGKLKSQQAGFLPYEKL